MEQLQEIYCRYTEAAAAAALNQTKILIDDGLIELRVEETTSTEVDFEETFPDESDPDDHISTETLPEDPDHDFS